MTPLREGEHVQVMRGKHRGRTGVVAFDAVDRYGRPIQSVAVVDAEGERIFHSVKTLQRIAEEQPNDH